jgi:hypothetical protein
LFIVIVLACSVAEIGYASAQQGFESYSDPYFGVTMERPSGWYIEGDNPWLHSDITPWHLPLIPLKELQPTAVDILLEGKKTQVVDFESGDDDTSAIVRVSVEKTPFGMSLDGYAQHTVERISHNVDNAKVDEMSRTTIDGNPAIRLVITFGDSEDSARTTQILTVYGNLAYVFQYDSSVAYYDTNLAAANHVFESIKISPPASRAQILLIPMAGIGISLAAIIGIKARKRNSFTSLFLRETKRLFPSSFGIEVLCVASAEIGGFLALWHYGFNTFGITMSYVMAYAFAGFTTFASILGRSSHAHDEDEIICGCGDMEHNSKIGFGAGIKQTFVNFASGLSMMARLHRKTNARRIIKASLIVLISAESGCIIAAATIDVMLYQYSAFLSIPAALLAGTLTVASMAAYRSIKREFVQKSTHGH